MLPSRKKAEEADSDVGVEAEEVEVDTVVDRVEVVVDTTDHRDSGIRNRVGETIRCIIVKFAKLVAVENKLLRYV